MTSELIHMQTQPKQGTPVCILTLQLFFFFNLQRTTCSVIYKKTGKYLGLYKNALHCYETKHKPPLQISQSLFISRFEQIPRRQVQIENSSSQIHFVVQLWTFLKYLQYFWTKYLFIWGLILRLFSFFFFSEVLFLNTNYL